MAKVCRKHKISFHGLRCPACTAPPVVKEDSFEPSPTGRDPQSSPAIQGVPVPRTPEGDRVREQFVPPRMPRMSDVGMHLCKHCHRPLVAHDPGGRCTGLTTQYDPVEA